MCKRQLTLLSIFVRNVLICSTSLLGFALVTLMLGGTYYNQLDPLPSMWVIYICVCVCLRMYICINCCFGCHYFTVYLLVYKYSIELLDNWIRCWSIGYQWVGPHFLDAKNFYLTITSEIKLHSCRINKLSRAEPPLKKNCEILVPL